MTIREHTTKQEYSLWINEDRPLANGSPAELIAVVRETADEVDNSDSYYELNTPDWCYVFPSSESIIEMLEKEVN